MMDAWRASLQGWIEQRSGREKVLLGAGLALAVAWLIIAAVWQPLRSHRANLQVEISRLDRGLAALQNPGFNLPDANPPAIDSRPVPVVITDTAAVFQLVIRRLEAEGTGARVVLEEATFQQVILWLEALERDHDLRVRDLEMTRRPGPGMVGVTLALER